MLREIKFRAWDKKNRVMTHSDDSNQEYGWFTGNDGCMICVRIEEKRDIKLNNIMQYTGLKDMNGKEIYEGDVIKENGWDDIFYLVVFEDCKFIAKKIGHHNGDIFTKRDKELDGVMWPVIVGDKYRNPELLEGEVNVSN